jgi:carbon-monoxide dehydrogenase iron sulfur subunit
MKTVFVNPERCVGCRQCEFACAVEHSHTRDPVLALYEDPPPRPRIHVQAGSVFNTSFPNKCRHCDPAPCAMVCPTAAIRRDTRDDLVLIDASRCIACAMCAMVCPFDVLTFHALSDGAAPRITAVKCDGCTDRLARGDVPACVETCKVEALVFGELNELTEAGRVRVTRATLAASTAIAPAAPAAPETVVAWRAWGEAAAGVAAETGGAQR